MDNTMLIVDDVEMNREILKLLFQDDYMILEAETGKEALYVMDSCRENVDIVLLDLVMPDMDGLEVLKKRTELDYFKNIPVVVITGSESMEDQIKAFELGASDFINKPFIPEIVSSRIHNVMASRRRVLDIELAAAKLKVKSELDQMTGLYNKTTVEYTIQEILSKYPNEQHALMVIDIDNFKSVNDTSGHLAGDHTIRIVADLISGLFRKTDIIGRIGGDEYVVLMVNVQSAENARAKAHELTQLMRYKPNLSIPENVTLSIGFASSEGKPIDYTTFFKRADEALYMAKENGKAQYCEYGSEPVDMDNDVRYAALLLSRNRNICSVVHASMPPDIRVAEVLDVQGLDRIRQGDRGKIFCSYIDVSDVKDAKIYWESVKQCQWLWEHPVVAICQEGDMEQYKAAMLAGVSDILSAPLESYSFKRRAVRMIET